MVQEVGVRPADPCGYRLQRQTLRAFLDQQRARSIECDGARLIGGQAAWI
jgi:hypothetical protein